MMTRLAVLKWSQSAPYVIDALSLLGSHCSMTHLTHVLWTIPSWPSHIYSIEILLYSLHFTTYNIPFSPLKSLPKYNLSSELGS